MPLETQPTFGQNVILSPQGLFHSKGPGSESTELASSANEMTMIGCTSPQSQGCSNKENTSHKGEKQKS